MCESVCQLPCRADAPLIGSTAEHLPMMEKLREKNQTCNVSLLHKRSSAISQAGIVTGLGFLSSSPPWGRSLLTCSESGVTATILLASAAALFLFFLFLVIRKLHLGGEGFSASLCLPAHPENPFRCCTRGSRGSSKTI